MLKPPTPESKTPIAIRNSANSLLYKGGAYVMLPYPAPHAP
jgi:hypothetical protein